MKKILYIMDPQCGWCYGNSQNMVDLYQEFGEVVEFEVAVGGMWIGDSAPIGGPGLANFIAQHSPAMEQTTGAEVSTKFYNLAKDTSYTFSSFEPSAAIVLVKKIAPAQAFLFAKAVQRAMFVDGHRLDELATYIPILKAMKIDTDTFEQQWLSQENKAATQAEFERVAYMANGFPTTIWQENDELTLLASGYFNKANMIATIKAKL